MLREIGCTIKSYCSSHYFTVTLKNCNDHLRNLYHESLNEMINGLWNNKDEAAQRGKRHSSNKFFPLST